MLGRTVRHLHSVKACFGIIKLYVSNSIHLHKVCEGRQNSMYVRLTRAVVLFLVVALVGVGCSKPGAEYLGKWQNTKNTKNNNDQFEIVRNGDNFLVTKSSKSGHGKPTTLSCVLRDGILQSTGGFGTATLTYVKATDRLTTPGFLGGNIEYERVK